MAAVQASLRFAERSAVQARQIEALALAHRVLHARIERGDEPPERLTLAFHTADVIVSGARLAKLVEMLREQSLAAVMPLDARYAGTLGVNPWVARPARVLRPVTFDRSSDLYQVLEGIQDF